MCMEKNLQEVADYLKDKKGFNAIVAAEKTGDKFDFGIAGDKGEVLRITQALVERVRTDLKEMAIQKPVDSLQADATALNTQKGATATFVVNIEGDQINYGFAGSEKEQEIMQMILNFIHIFHKKD